MSSIHRFVAFVIFAFLATSNDAFATIFWAAPNGSHTIACDSVSGNADPGTYATIGRAANCAVTAGDSIYIKPGTYTGGNHQIKTDAGTTGLASGTAQAYTTVTGVPGQAKPVINISNWFTTYRPPANRNYIAIRNLIVDGDCVAQGRACDSGAEIYLNGSYLIVDDVEIRNSWNVGVASFSSTADTTACSWNHHHTIRNSKFQSMGGDGNGYAIYANACDTVFEHNEVTSARGGAIQIYQDSPFSVDRPIIRYNYIHNMQISTQSGFIGYCFGIALDGANSQIHHNVLDMTGCASANSGDAIATGYGNTAGNVTINHNLIYGARSNGISLGVFTTGGTSGNSVKNNIILGSGGAPIMPYNGSTSTTTNNKTTGAITDCTVSTSNFTHKSNSTCIDAGSAIANETYDGVAPDIGPFETFSATSASISGTTLTLAFATSAILPATSITSFSVNNGRNVISASRPTSQTNTINLNLSGVSCSMTETWSVNYTPGNVTDSVNIGNPLGVSLNQPLHNFTRAVTNNCAAGNGGKPSAPKNLKAR